MNLFKYFKLKKKRKLEQQLKKFILFNEWKIECYEKYPKRIESPTKEFLDNITCIAMGYDKSLWPSFDKYNINTIIVYPALEMKEEYIKRYKRRGNDQKFIDFISNNWNNFINEIDMKIMDF